MNRKTDQENRFIWTVIVIIAFVAIIMAYYYFSG